MFDAGQQVRCIDASGAAPQLSTGALYRVVAAYGQYVDVGVCEPGHPNPGYLCKRFRAATDIEPLKAIVRRVHAGRRTTVPA